MGKAEEFFWWWVERQTGVPEEAVRNDPTIQRIVKEEADSRNMEVFNAVMDELRRQEECAVEQAPENDSTPDESLKERRPASRQPVTDAGITVAEAARRLGCSGSKAYRLFNCGDLTGHKVGDKIVIDPVSVEAYKQRHTNTASVRESTPEKRPGPRRRFRHLDL
jgi:excisionase family DNA binding protein